MELTSPAFPAEGAIPSAYTCDGSNYNPELHISGVPTTAKSLVLIMDDPDVPPSVRADRMYDHWVLYNIPPDTREIPEKTKSPLGTRGKGTGGSLDYQGPCPPDREHRYFFKLFALDTLLPLPEGATKPQVEKAMQGHILAKTQLMGRYVKLR